MLLVAFNSMKMRSLIKLDLIKEKKLNSSLQFEFFNLIFTVQWKKERGRGAGVESSQKEELKYYFIFKAEL